jgi:hypothetical protein
MVVDTRNWLPGKKVLIAPRWIDRVSWNDSYDNGVSASSREKYNVNLSERHSITIFQ